jgi:hypothetical protein
VREEIKDVYCPDSLKGHDSEEMIRAIPGWKKMF